MEEKIKDLLQEIAVFKAESKEQLEQFRIKFLGKKGVLTDLFGKMKELEPAIRKDYGKWVNDLKIKAEEKLLEYRVLFENREETTFDGDLTLPGEDIGLRASIRFLL